MGKKVLFLNGSSKIEFYNNERNKYENVTAASIFKSNSILSKVLRKLIIISGLPGLFFLFDDWKRDIKDYDLFILSSSIYNLEIAKYIRKRSDKRIIHWYWNPVRTEVKPDKIRGYGCEFFSFDQEDCKQYGMNFISTYYFKNIKLPHNKISNDIYFIGADKGRIDKLLEMKKAFEDQGLNAKFHITKSANLKTVKNYTFQPKISYAEVMEEISRSRAILDIIQVGQSGASQRPMEALFYSKKLITNDIDISKYDFYNSNNIFILGRDNIADLKEFINSPYCAIKNEIVEKYDFGNWLNQLQNHISI